jgi:hypothetical protein
MRGMIDYAIRMERADERTRTADLLITSVPMALQGCAEDCKIRISRPVSFLRLHGVAPYCARGGVRVVSEVVDYTSPGPLRSTGE